MKHVYTDFSGGHGGVSYHCQCLAIPEKCSSHDYLCMASARHSLSPTASSLLGGQHKTTPKLFDYNLTERGAGADLEDGEITDEAKLDEAETAVKEGVAVAAPISNTKMGTPSTNGAPDEPEPLPIPTAAEQLDLLVAHPSQAAWEPELKRPSVSILASNTPRALSPEELDLAKNIVLDLLGWGVQPEYLVECGVSSHAIYRIFTDLRLRLPSNLSYLG